MGLLFFRFIFTLFFTQSLFGGFTFDTLVKVPDGYKPISQLVVGDTIVSCDHDGKKVHEKVLLTTQYYSEKVCHCTSESNNFYAGSGQLIFNAATKSFVLPHELSINDDCACQTIDNKEIELYEIIISGNNHLFYITESDIPVHNMIEIPLEIIQLVGNQMTFRLNDVYAALLHAGFIFAVEFFNNVPQKLYLVQDTDTEKNLLLAKNNANKNTVFYRPHNSKERYCSMNEFFKNTKFGRDIKNRLRKVHQLQYKGAYEVIEDIGQYNLKKGDIIYVDRAHCDHLEWFDSHGNPIGVLNFDGLNNQSKSNRISGRKLCL